MACWTYLRVSRNTIMNVYYPFVFFFEFPKIWNKINLSRVFSSSLKWVQISFSLFPSEKSRALLSRLRSLRRSLPRVYSVNRAKKIFLNITEQNYLENALSSRALLSQVNHHPAAAWSATLSAIAPLQEDTAGAQRLRGTARDGNGLNARKKKTSLREETRGTSS